jgi:dynein heavy chain
MVIDAIDGIIAMSNDIESLSNSIFDNVVPSMWHKYSYNSAKKLASWFKDYL